MEILIIQLDSVPYKCGKIGNFFYLILFTRSKANFSLCWILLMFREIGDVNSLSMSKNNVIFVYFCSMFFFFFHTLISLFFQRYSAFYTVYIFLFFDHEFSATLSHICICCIIENQFFIMFSKLMLSFSIDNESIKFNKISKLCVYVVFSCYRIRIGRHGSRSKTAHGKTNRRM